MLQIRRGNDLVSEQPVKLIRGGCDGHGGSITEGGD